MLVRLLAVKWNPMCVEIGVWTLPAVCLTTHHKSNVTSGRMPPLHGRKKNQFAKKHSPKEQLCDLNEVTKRQSTESLHLFFPASFSGCFLFPAPGTRRKEGKAIEEILERNEVELFLCKIRRFAVKHRCISWALTCSSGSHDIVHSFSDFCSSLKIFHDVLFIVPLLPLDTALTWQTNNIQQSNSTCTDDSESYPFSLLNRTTRTISDN